MIDLLLSTALDKGGYNINQNEPLEIQFTNMFLDFVDCGQFRDIGDNDEALDILDEYGIERVAKSMIKILK